MQPETVIFFENQLVKGSLYDKKGTKFILDYFAKRRPSKYFEDEKVSDYQLQSRYN